MKLTVLHISDIHFESAKDSILAHAQSIASSVYSSARATELCLIAVTGDIAFSGQTAEYKVAYEFISRIKQAIHGETGKPVYVVVVPGNHDCILKPVDDVREVLIQQISQKPALAEKENIVAQCVLAQSAFFEFRKLLPTPQVVFDSPQWTEYAIEENGSVMRISALNAAWMSRLPEEPGDLVFPLGLYDSQLTAAADIRLVLLHQPYHWHQQRSYHEMRARLRRSATAVLSGHEHFGNSGKIDEEVSGASLYFEAGALQPHESDINPGYAVYHFDKAAGQVAVHRFTIENNVVAECSETAIYEIPAAGEKNQHIVEFTADWCADLNNPGGYFVHSEKRDIVLDDIFIYPDLKDWENDEPGRLSNISSEKLVAKLKEGATYLLLGEEKAGKSTLLHFYAKQLVASGYAPVYVKASELNNIRKQEDVHLRLMRFVEKQFANPKALQNLPRQKRVLLVDDVDRFKSGISAIPAFLEYAEKHFGSIVLTANKSFEVTALASQSASEAFRKFPKYELMRFGLKLRHRLIKKWCGLGQLNSLAELDKRVHHAENIVNTVIGRNLVPQLPIYLLILLQSCDHHQQGEIQNSGFSHYYQFLITKSLGQVGIKPQEIDEHYNYLSHLAWFMQSKNSRELELEDLRQFNAQFSSTFTSVDLQSRLELLVEARILSKRSGCFSFAYPYVFYFFIGKYLSLKMYTDPSIKSWVQDACAKLYLRDNANAILFLTHHDSNPWVIERIAEVMKSCFHEKEPMQFNGDTLAINELVSTASQLVLSAPNVEKNQEEVRDFTDQLDESNPDEPDVEPDENGELAFVAKFTLLFKTAEILGQILKNYYGSLEKPFKAELLREVFDGPLRALRLQLEEIASDMDGFVAYIENIVFKDEKLLSSEERARLARKASFNVLGWLGTSVISASAYFVANDKLREDVAALVRSNPTIAYRLIDIGTRLIRPGHIPVEEIDKLAKEVKDNHYAFGILQSLGVNHLYQFHTDASEKQRLCNSLKISVSDAKAIEVQGRDIRLSAS